MKSLLTAILLIVKALLASNAIWLVVKALLASKLRRKICLGAKVLLVAECKLKRASILRLLRLRQRQEIGREALVPVVIHAHILLIILIAIAAGQGGNTSHAWKHLNHFIGAFW